MKDLKSSNQVEKGGVKSLVMPGGMATPFMIWDWQNKVLNPLLSL